MERRILDNSIEAAKHAQFYDLFWKIEEIGINRFQRLRANFIVDTICNHSTTQRPRILELGCGTGWLSTFVSNLGSYVGADYSAKAFEYARCVYKMFGKFYLADATDPFLGITEREFDVVIASEVIEHVKDHKAFLAQVNLFLKKGGLFILTTPNGALYNIFSKKYKEQLQPVENWLTPIELRSLLIQNGFDIIFHEGMLYRYPIYGLKAYLISSRLEHLFNFLQIRHLYRKILLENAIYQLLSSRRTD